MYIGKISIAFLPYCFITPLVIIILLDDDEKTKIKVLSFANAQKLSFCRSYLGF